MTKLEQLLAVGDRVVSEANMLGTVLALRFGRLGEGAARVWIATVQWQGRYASTSCYLAKRLRLAGTDGSTP